jgi:superfamily I DNA/RNA helicase/mRNA-degrading endonuclease RelE of RelBE toxin-antitoxin system
VSKKREINIKPSCMSEIHGFPADQAAQLWEKINYLVEDPFPDGKLKKKLKARKDIYRVRVGNFRVFYTFGDDWVRLLGIRRRNERTFDDTETIYADEPTQLPDDQEVDIDSLDVEQRPRPQFAFTPTVQETPLPRTITPEWLNELRIPASYFSKLTSCTTEEALLTTAVPPAVLERVLDNLFPLPIEEVERQPDLVVRDTNDLIKYKEGGLVSFLLKLDDDQKKLVDWGLKGPTMIKGGAGTGKSTIALYRAKALLDLDEGGNAKLLFTTYTRALITATQQLLDQLLSKEQLKRVRIASCDELAREIVAKYRKVGSMESGGTSLQVLHEVRTKFSPSAATAFDVQVRIKSLETLSDRYILEEFDWIIDGRGLLTLQEYLDAPRPGRGCVFRSGLREAIWQLHSAFKSEMAARKIERWSDLRAEALDLVRRGAWKEKYKYVIVDEAQDLAPTSLCLLAELAEAPEGLFFAADNKQSLYSKNYSWTTTDPRLQFRGRTRGLKRNYRSTAEIDRAAFNVLPPDPDEPLEPSSSVHSGPLPIVVQTTSLDKQAEWIEKFIRQMAKHLRMKTSSSAVLVPSREIGETIASSLDEHGLPAKFYSGRELDLHEDVVKVLTLYSAKGLEFPIVAVCGFEPGTYPVAEDFANEDVFRERMNHERKVLYVALSRAMRGLMVVRGNNCRHEALDDLNSDHWHREMDQ